MNSKQSFFKRYAKNKELFLLSLPALIFIFIFSYIPLYGLIIPFKNYRYDLSNNIFIGLMKSPWAGIENFKFLFNTSDAFIITRNTILYNAAFIFFLLIFSVAFALMLNQLSRKSVKFYQTSMFFPYFLSWVVVSYVFLGFLDMEHGFVNSLLAGMGKDAVLWYNDPKYWPFLLILGNTWKNVGYYTIIYYAALIAIDPEYYEAAELDGANKLQQIWTISLPFLKPLMILLVLLQVGKIFFGNFDLFYNLPRDTALLYSTTDVIDTFVYRALRTNGDIGMASAAGVYQSVVGFVIVIVTNFIIKKKSPENSIF